MSKVQSVIFNRRIKKWSLNDAKKWILNHNFKIKKIDINYDINPITKRKYIVEYRFRQMNPDLFKKFYTGIIKNGEIHLIYGTF